MKRVLRAAALAVALAAAGCARRHAVLAPAAELPPAVVATSPPARSLHVPNDTAIWAEFDRPLDLSTVDTRHVFLKVDTRRQPITLGYDTATNRVTIVPVNPLVLRTTYTVELAPGLRSADGDSLGQTYFWQFTILGVRKPAAPYPLDGATGESPFAELLWGGTESSAGAITYDVFIGTDSAAVASHASAVAHLNTAFYLPAQRWAQGAANYWDVRVTNNDTHEQVDGGVWRFDVLPANTPVDSVVVPLKSWFDGFQDAFSGLYRASCNPATLIVGGAYDNLEHWNFASQGPGVRLAGAAISVTPFTPDGTTHGLAVSSVHALGNVCTGAPQPLLPPVGGAILAAAVPLPDQRLFLQSDPLATFAEAAIRHGGPDALMFRTTSQFGLRASASGNLDPYAPGLILYVYRTSAPAPASRR